MTEKPSATVTLNDTIKAISTDTTVPTETIATVQTASKTLQS